MTGVNAELMAQLESMGFPAKRAKRALRETGNSNADAATQWLFDHMDDPSEDEEEPIRQSDRPINSNSPTGPRDAKRAATLSSSMTGHLSTVRVPTPKDKVYKDECVYCFDNAEARGGLFICLNTWRGMCRSHAEMYNKRSGQALFVRINVTKTLKEESIDEDKVNPSVNGVVVHATVGPRYEYSTTTTIVTLPQGSEICSGDDLDLPSKVRQSVQAIVDSDSAARVEESMAWQEMRSDCPHALTLQQKENNVTIPSSGRHQCNKCEMTDNLWLNLTDGTLLCGRKNFDGTGGNGHAADYYKETKHPIAVKMGTISADGGDVYCYECDDMVIDKHLGNHLMHYGINMVGMEKTEKTMAELELEQNMKHEWNVVTESGQDLIALYGPGYTGLRNLGNSCYLASTMQLLFSIPEYAANFSPTKEVVFKNGRSTTDPVNDLDIQLGKLSYGLLSGDYSQRPSASVEDEETPELHNGIRPSSFKTVVGKGHQEFSTSRQQDALEFFQYFLSLSERQNRASGALSSDKQTQTQTHTLQSLFRYQVEERLECGATAQVRYTTTHDNVLSLALPLDAAENKQAVSEYALKIAEGIECGNVLTEESCPTVRPVIPFSACLSSYLAPSEMSNWKSPATQTMTTAIKTHRFLTFPPYLMVHARRFYVDDDWTPKKLDVELDMPEIIDLECLRGSGGLLEREIQLPETTAAPQLQLDETVVAELAAAGFSDNACRRATFNTHGQGTAAAMEWICGHLDDADLNDPFIQSGFVQQGTTEESAKLEASEEHVSMLVAMGFTVSQSKKALHNTDHNVERAVDWLFSHGDQVEVMDLVDENDSSGASLSLKATEFQTGPPQYELVGFISHIGSSTLCGHYVCHVKKDGKHAHSLAATMTYILDSLLDPLLPIVNAMPVAQRAWVPLVVALLVASVTELINYAFLYRKPEFKQIIQEINNAQEKLNKEEKSHRKRYGVNSTIRNKKLPFLETKVSDPTNRLTKMKMYSMMASAVVFMAFMSSVNNVFSGIVFAKLPFRPFSLAHNITHRGLEGEDFYESSFLFIYVLCTMALRQLIPKMLGVTHLRAKPGDSFIAGLTAASV
eukprot:CFRG5659T1